MKKHLLIMWSLLLCFATGAWADEVTIDFSQKGYANGTAVASVEQDGITITFDKGTNKNNAPKYYTDGTAVRAYGGNTFTVSSSNTITKIELTFSGGSNEITADVGTFESPTWTGSTTSVMFTIGGTSGHRRIQKIVVTYNPPAGTPMAPTISGKTSFVGSTSVEIANNEDGATVYFTLDESDPTTSTTAQKYTDAFDISATTTVKAAAKKGDKWSSVASKTFTAIPSYANIEALTALGNNTTFGFTGELLVVAKPTDKYAYVKDATGATLIYDDSETKLGNLEKGKTIAAPWTGKVSIYNKLFEAVPDAALTLKDGETVTVKYDEASIADLTFDNVNKVVVLKGVTYTLGTGKNLTIKQGETERAGYNNFGLTIEAAEEGKTYDIVGAISRYNDNIQFQPISITKTPELGSYEIKIVNTDGLTITPEVTTAKAGDKVYASFKLADHYQLEVPDFVDDDGQPIEFTEDVTIGLEEVGGEEKMWFIMPEKNVTIKAKATKLYQLSVTQPEKGAITVIDVNMDDPYSKAEKTIRMMVTANEGYVIKSVEVKDANDAAVPVSAGSGTHDGQAFNYFFTMPASNVKIGATIQKGPEVYQLSVTQPENGTITVISVNMDDPYSIAGKDISMMVTANEGYVIKSVEVKDANDVAVAVRAESGIHGGQAFNYVFTMPASDVKIGATIQKKPEDIKIDPETGTDISQALAAASEGKNVRNIAINLNAGEYTMSAPIVAGGNIIIDGAEGAKIDASAVSGPLFQYVAPAANHMAPAVRRAPATPVDGYTYIDEVSIKNVTITGIKGSLYWDGNVKVCIEKFAIENAVLGLATESSSLKDNTIVSFQGGSAKDFIVKNSTIYGNAVARYFNKASGNDAVKAGYDEVKVTYENNTFYKVLSSNGEWGNNLRYNTNKAKVVATINNNIWVDNGNGQIMRRLFNTAFSGLKAGSAMANNLFQVNDAVVDQSTYGNGSDINGVVTFTNTETPDFGGTVALKWGTEEPTTQIGDGRWTLTYTQKGIMEDGKYFVMGLNYDNPAQWLDGSKLNDFGVEFTATFDATAKTYTLQAADGKYLQADLTLGETTFGWTVDEDAVYGQNIYTIDGGVKKYIAVDENKNLVLTENAADPSIGWGFFPADYFWAAVAPRTIIGTVDLTGTAEDWQADAKNFMTRNELTGLWEKTYKLVEVTEEKKPEFKVALNGDATKAYPAEARVITLADFGTEAQAGIYNITISYNDEGNVVSVSGVKVEPEDIVINSEDLGAVYGVMNLALDAALDGKLAKSITFNLGEGISYSVTEPLETGVNLTINGAAGATIDASGLTGPFISLSATPGVEPTMNTEGTAAIAYPIDGVTIQNVKITGLSQQLVKSNNLYLVKDLKVLNSVVEKTGNKAFFDFSGTTGGNVINLTVDNSTLYANGVSWSNGGFFTSQTSKKLNQMGVNVDAEGFTASTTITNSTIYNIAYTKTTSSLIQNSQNWMRYVVKYNVIVNSGKKEEFLKGLNAGQAGKDANWDVDGNIFNFDNANIVEKTVGSTADNIKNSVTGVVTFTDAAAGDFNGVVELPYGATEPTSLGDGRWTLSYTHAPVEHTYIVAGNSDIFGTPWDPTNESNKMTNNGDGTYSKTYTVSEAVNGIELKVVEDGTTWYGDAEGQNVMFDLSAAGSFTVNFDPATGIVTVTGDIVTGINAISADKAAENLENAEIYTLNGQRVEKPRKGLYIVNGKKVVIK